MERALAKHSSTASTSLMSPDRQKRALPNKCKVCGDFAKYSYYGAIACHSCKMFFKRNAEKKQTKLKCSFLGHCEIDVNNRHACGACRLAKCFESGMLAEMIRSPRCNKNKAHKNKRTDQDSRHLPSTTTSALMPFCSGQQRTYIPTLDLLESDRSSLSVDQWNLLSNLVHCYNQYSGYRCVENFLREQSQLPLKLRFRHLPVCNFMTSLKSNIQLTLEKNRNFLALSRSDRTKLLHGTVAYSTSAGAMFIMRQFALLEYPHFYQSAEMIFQPSSARFTRQVIEQFDHDDTFVKIVLALLSFSTIGYTVYKDDVDVNLTNIKVILPIQDAYTELAWRYLTYKYGHREAVCRFSNLTRCLLSVMSAIVAAHQSHMYEEMVDTVIRQTEHVLCL